MNFACYSFVLYFLNVLGILVGKLKIVSDCDNQNGKLKVQVMCQHFLTNLHILFTGPDSDDGKLEAADFKTAPHVASDFAATSTLQSNETKGFVIFSIIVV